MRAAWIGLVFPVLGGTGPTTLLVFGVVSGPQSPLMAVVSRIINTLSFKSPLDFRKWLEKNNASSDGIWLRIFKKDSGEQSITYAEALDQALCYGWVDGQKRARDEHSWLQKFTPRRAKSGWSKINTQHA